MSMLGLYLCYRRVRSDSVQSDQKSVHEEAEEENESNQEKKLPGDLMSLFCLHEFLLHGVLPAQIHAKCSTVLLICVAVDAMMFSQLPEVQSWL